MKPTYLQLTDKHLASLLQQGDKHAFNAIFERYWKRLYAYAYHIHAVEALCEDSIQEVFINLWDKRMENAIEYMEGYLFRAVKYKIANQLRDRKSTIAQEGVLQSIPESSKVDKKLEFQDFERFLNLHIEQLAPRCRKVFMLSRFEHYSNREIAERLNISVRTVEKHISDALRALRNALAPYHSI